MDNLPYRSTLGAMRSAIDRAVPGGLLTGPHTILDLGNDCAAYRTVSAYVPFDRCFCPVQPVGGRSTSKDWRKNTDAGERASCQSRLLQEFASAQITTVDAGTMER